MDRGRAGRTGKLECRKGRIKPWSEGQLLTMNTTQVALEEGEEEPLRVTYSTQIVTDGAPQGGCSLSLETQPLPKAMEKETRAKTSTPTGLPLDPHLRRPQSLGHCKSLGKQSN